MASRAVEADGPCLTRKELMSNVVAWTEVLHGHFTLAHSHCSILDRMVNEPGG